MEKISAVIAAAGLGTILKNYTGNTSTKILIDTADFQQIKYKINNKNYVVRVSSSPRHSS